jgi:subtilisin family serine protease
MGSYWRNRRRFVGTGVIAVILITLGGITAGVASTAPAPGEKIPPREAAPSAVDELALDTSLDVAATASFRELEVAAAATGTVRVIVNLQLAWTPEPLLDAASRATQTMTIAARQDAVLASLAGTDHRVLHRYSFIPYVAVELGHDAIQALEGSGLAAAVEIDVADPVALGDSIPLINADDAWTAGYDGSGQVVAVLDSGVDSTHPFLTGRIVEEACFSLGGDCPNASTVQLGTGAGVNCSYSADCEHGTHVAGIAAGLAPAGDSGVAKGADVMAVQVFSRFDSPVDCGSSPVPCALSYVSDQLAGLERVYEVRNSHDIAAVNMSIGGSTPYTTTCDTDSRKSAIDNLLAAGIATVISSGNSGYEDATGKPGCISTAITVASSTKSDLRSSFSNTAPFVDLIAPGSDIYSSVPGGGFDFKSGTSMAAPHVAGAWAILKEAFPTASVSEVLTAFQNTGPLIEVRSSPTEYLPRIDVAAALAAVIVTPPLANDDFANAELVAVPAVLSASTGTATTEPSEPLTCDDVDVGLSPFGATVWYELAPSSDLLVTLDTTGSGFDTVIAVNTGGGLGSLTQVACDDDTGGFTDSYVEFVAIGGMTYWIQVGGYGDPAAAGDLDLSITGTAYDATAPAWPGGSVVEASDVYADRMTVSWSAAEDAIGVSSYAVYVNGAMVTTTSARSYQIDGLAAKTSYGVRVEAGDANGNWSMNAGPTGTFTTAQVFTDTAGLVFEDDIEWLSGAAITAGCNPPINDQYCPNDFVTRGQMAAFLVRALGLSDSGSGDLFTDDDGSIFESSIDKLGTAGVTRGCNPPVNDLFCPHDLVTRGQMAAFLVRAVGYTDDGGGNLFSDDDGSVFESAIDKLGTAGVTRGCNPPVNDRFCPNDFVTRGQMAAFLRRALG